MKVAGYKRIDMYKTFRVVALIAFFLLVCIGFHWQYFNPDTIFMGSINSDSGILHLRVNNFMLAERFNGFWSWYLGFGHDVNYSFAAIGASSIVVFLQFVLVRILGVCIDSFDAMLNIKLVTSITRQFFAMFFMYGLLRYENKKYTFAIIGAVLYATTLWHLREAAVQRDTFADTLLWLPLIVWGVRKYQASNKPLLLYVSLTIAFFNNIIFGFASGIFFVSYCILFSEGKNFKEYVYKLGKFAGISMLSLLSASLVIIAVVLGLSDTARMGSELIFPNILPPPSTLIGFWQRIFSPYSVLSVTPIILFIFTVPMKSYNNQQIRKLVLCILWIALTFSPFFTAFMNIFTHTHTRWFYIVTFVVAYFIPDLLEKLVEDKESRIIPSLIISIVLLAWLYIVSANGITTVHKVIVVSQIFAIIMLGVYPKIKKRAIAVFSSVLVIVIIFSGTAVGFLVTPNAPGEATRHGSLNEWMFGTDAHKNLISQIRPNENEFFRIIQYSSVRNVTATTANFNLNSRVYSTSFYNVVTRNLHNWIINEHNISCSGMRSNQYRGLDNRLFLENAWGVRYLTGFNRSSYFPGYERRQHESGEVYFESINHVDFDLWYEYVIPHDVYYGFSFAERDAAILQAAFVEGVQGIYPYANLDDATISVPVEISDIEFTNSSYNFDTGVLTVGENAEIIIHLPKIDDGWGEFLISSTVINPTGNNAFSMTVNRKIITRLPNTNPYAIEHDIYAVSVHGSAEQITITISPGVYYVSDLSLSFNSYRYMSDWVDAVNRYNMDPITIGRDRIDGRIETSSSGILAFRMPYVAGWRVYVNGERQPLVMVNRIFPGVELQPGVHYIELRYVPRYLLPGVSLSLLGVVLYISIFHRVQIKNLASTVWLKKGVSTVRL